MKLNKYELLKVSGGGSSFGIVAAIGGAIAFLISVVDGFVNPKRCNL